MKNCTVSSIKFKENFDLLISAFYSKFKIDLREFLNSVYIGMPFSECAINQLNLIQDIFSNRDLTGKEIFKKVKDQEEIITRLEGELEQKIEEQKEEILIQEKQQELKEKAYLIRIKLDKERIEMLTSNLEMYENNLKHEDKSKDRSLLKLIRVKNKLADKEVELQNTKLAFTSLKVKLQFFEKTKINLQDKNRDVTREITRLNKILDDRLEENLKLKSFLKNKIDKETKKNRNMVK